MIHGRDDYDRIQDPLDLIRADEPVFLLRAQDFFAATVVRYYAQLIREHARESLPEKEKWRDFEMAKACEDHAEKMERYPIKKFPDIKFLY